MCYNGEFNTCNLYTSMFISRFMTNIFLWREIQGCAQPLRRRLEVFTTTTHNLQWYSGLRSILPIADTNVQNSTQALVIFCCPQISTAFLHKREGRVWRGCKGLPALQPVSCPARSCMIRERHWCLVYHQYTWSIGCLCYLVQYTCPTFLPLFSGL